MGMQMHTLQVFGRAKLLDDALLRLMVDDHGVSKK